MQVNNAPRRKQAGYSLVELGIVLAVVGLMASGIIYPLGAKLRDKAQNKVTTQMSQAVEAVVGYAFVNRTPGALYRHHDVASIFPNAAATSPRPKSYGYRLTRIPSGRPYLPCPDTDGDGIENRGVLQVPVATYPLAIVGDSSNRHILRDPPLSSITDPTIGGNVSSTSLIAIGICTRAYGDLPWRTLGLKPTDPWGNHFTYYVSGRFSTGLFGFDQLTRSSLLNDLVEINFPTSSNFRTRASAVRLRDGLPLYVCDPGVISATTLCTPKQDLNTASQARIDSTVILNRHYGKYAFPLVSSNTLGIAFDGLPFAIISHGPNGKGAFIHHSTPTQCKGFPDLTSEALQRQSAEAMNAVYSRCTAADVPDIDVQIDTAGNPGSIIVSSPVQSIDDDHPARYGYIYALGRANATAHEQRVSSVLPSNATPVGEFDDSVAWLTRRELLTRMINLGVLPVEEPFTGFISGTTHF